MRYLTGVMCSLFVIFLRLVTNSFSLNSQDHKKLLGTSFLKKCSEQQYYGLLKVNLIMSNLLIVKKIDRNEMQDCIYYV